jgi:phosphoribosylglycinamide formyltransferase-1
MTKIAVFISGRGSNLKAIHSAIINNYIRSTCIAVVISDSEKAQGLNYCKDNNIETFVVESRDYSDKLSFNMVILDKLISKKVDLLCLAGFMKIIPKVIVDIYYGKIMNIHPSLLPSFPGLSAQKQALDYGVKLTGATVHFVDEKMDHGPIILQKVVEVLDGDTVETLSDRILAVEHQVYPEAIKLYVEGRLQITGRKVVIKSPD